MLTLDHIAIAATDLEAGARDVAEALGVPLGTGGQHAAMGTHNRLLSLGPDEYLEVIEVDPGAEPPRQPRWFDLDRFAGPARATTWICRTEDLDAALAAAPEGVGTPWDLSRADLRWRMAVPGDGVLPFAGLFPALIAWQGTAHPAPRLPDRGVRLRRVELISPEAAALGAALEGLIADPRIGIVAGEAPRLRAVFDTPGGEVVL